MSTSGDSAASNPDVTDVGCPKCDYGRGDCTCEEIAGQPAASSDDLTLGDIEEQEMWEEHTRERIEQMAADRDAANDDALRDAQGYPAFEGLEAIVRAREERDAANDQDAPGAFGAGYVYNPAVFGDSPQRRAGMTDDAALDADA